MSLFHKNWHPNHLGLISLVVLLIGAPTTLVAQDVKSNPGNAQPRGITPPQAGQPEGDVILIFPSGDRATGILMVEAMAPAEVPVGRTYEYRIKVTNISRNLVLEDVQIHQTTPDGLTIESSEPKADQSEEKSAGTRWSVPRLNPGGSKQITVNALSDKEGIAAGCIRVEYKPSLCLATRFVKPAIQLTKQAPERADLCGPLTFRYTLKNTGTGAARGVKVTDELPKGLTTVEGKNALAFDVGELPAGESREFTAQINAAQTGEFSSRAVAQGENDLKAQSNGVTTVVQQAKLAVTINGPEAQNVNQAGTYRVEVKNEGDATAEGATLQVQVDRECRLIRMSKSAPGGVSPRQSSNSLTWNLGAVEPGKSSVVSFTTRAEGKATLEHTATATSVCARGGDIAKAASATTTTTTDILTYPALLVEMVDQEDPVKVGGTEVYTITVLNQGSGEDSDVKVVCHLPEELQFVEVTGPGEPKVEGQTITLGPIERLQPRERVTWKLQAKAQKAGDARTKIDLSSEYLSKPIVETEPTRLID